MNRPIMICEESFKITGVGIIVFLKHQRMGLIKDLVLKSIKTSQTWKIDSRILYYHTLNKHNLFENESKNYMRMSFKDEEKRKASIAKIIGEESKGIYQYLIKPIKHEEKPNEGEELVVIE